MKVAPRIVESAATLHPEVLEAVALGLPDHEWGEAVALAIRARTAVSLQDIREHLRDHVPSYALPKRLLLVDEMPLRGPGKPDRVALATAPGWQTLGH
ncbi:AMP-binding enzyme [Flexivirga alba]|uniref:AMP-binding enzyme C-terminal domain-containing protein n=1 Tax=Flexivirga alba TaxID=702742 RepID=A0ABW2ABG4_9MICO